MLNAILCASRQSRQPEFLTSSEAAALAGLSFMSINRAYDRGELSGHTLPSGHRRINRASLVEWAGITEENNEQQTTDENGDGLNVVYGRCSTDKQRDDLNRQVAELEAHAKQNYPGEKVLTIAEIGSGINCDRKGLNRLIDMALEGKVKRVLLTFSERLSRGSYGLLSRVLAKCGVEIILTRQHELEAEAKSLQDELIADCVALMTSVGAKINGKKASQKIRFIASPQLEARIATLWGQGLSKQGIIDAIRKEGHRCMNTNAPVGEWGCRVVIKKIQSGPQPVPSYITNFVRSYCALAPSKRVTTSKLWAAFKAACPKEAERLTPRKFIETLKAHVVRNGRIQRGSTGHLFYGITLRAGRC